MGPSTLCLIITRISVTITSRLGQGLLFPAIGQYTRFDNVFDDHLILRAESELSGGSCWIPNALTPIGWPSGPLRLARLTNP